MTTHPGYGADNEVKEFQGGGFLRDGEHKGILEIKRNRETSGGRYARLQARIFKALQNVKSLFSELLNPSLCRWVDIEAAEPTTRDQRQNEV